MLLVAGCSSDTQQSTDNTQEKAGGDTVLKVGLMPDIDSVPFIIAQEKGFFKDEGVTVELQHFKSAMDRDSALQSGNLDGGVSDMLAAGFAKAGGFDVKMTSMTDGNYCLIAGTANNAASISEMKGQNISGPRYPSLSAGFPVCSCRYSRQPAVLRGTVRRLGG